MIQMYGELPTYPVVMAACDSDYFLDHAEPFICSADRAGFDVHIHIINPTDEVLSLAAILSSVTDNKVTYTFNDLDMSIYSREQKRTFYACLRFMVAPQIIQYAHKVLILDIDCLIMQPFNFPNSDVGYFPREPLSNVNEWEREGTRVAAGAVYFSGKNGLKYAEDVAKQLNIMPLKWFVDQIALSKVLSNIDAYYFDNQFMDWEFHDDTVIWTGKGPRKYENVRYLNAKESYNILDKTFADIDNVILKPRMDLMFKRNGLTLSQPIADIRKYWIKMVNKLHNELGNSIIVESPRWFFNNTIERLYKAVTYVPHTEHQLFNGKNCLYYMQTVFPWLFTIDEQGWGGGAKFLSTFDSSMEYDDTTFNILSSYVYSGKSKFEQPKKDSFDRKDYIFVPLQLPHDETIKYHSDITVPEFVESLCKWADDSDNHIVFKGHPINIGSMEPIKEIISQYNNVTYVENISIKTLMLNSKAVYVINSGTGQEAMLFDKPVVTFGRCEYQGAVITGNINNLNDAWESIENINTERMMEMYRRWYYWYNGNIYNCLDKIEI